MSSKSVINDLGESEVQSSLEDFISLLKPRVMSLAVFTSVSGLILSPVTLHPFLCVLSIFCISLGAGASGLNASSAMNQFYIQLQGVVLIVAGACT